MEQDHIMTLKKREVEYPTLGEDFTIYDEPLEDVWDNIFLQQQFSHTEEENKLSEMLLLQPTPTHVYSRVRGYTNR